MNVIYEATKKDGTRKLVPTSFFKRIVETVNDSGAKNKMRTFGRLLATACFCRGWTRIDKIEYGLDRPVRKTVVIWC